MQYGRYWIVKELGKGSMGVVYQAYDPQIDRKIALKVLREDRTTSEAFVSRFLKEAKTIGRLSHPNIVTIYDAGKDQGTVYIAMEFIEGDPLNQVIEKRRFSLPEIVDLGIQVAETLDHAHQKGVVHRDIKPSNIIVQANGQIKITDFGIAHIEDSSQSIQTQAGEILGTPAYMSPEQVMSRPVDGRSDLFSLGIILYELSTGQRPFSGENIAALFNAIAQESPTPPARINPTLPQNLSQIIMKCLNKKPEERFDTASGLAEALKRGLEDKALTPSSVPIVQRGTKKIIFLSAFLLLFVCVIGGAYVYIYKPMKLGSMAVQVASTSLKVGSVPEGARVFVDGAPKGETPVKLKLPAGKHEIRLALQDYYHWEAMIELRDDGETPLFIRLFPIEDKKP